MIDKLLTESDILDYLMTSDFNEGLTQEESKFLLLKYRNFYRMAYSKYEGSKDVIERLKKDILDKEKELEIKNESLKNLEEDLNREKIRDLSWRERFFGKKINK